MMKRTAGALTCVLALMILPLLSASAFESAAVIDHGDQRLVLGVPAGDVAAFLASDVRGDRAVIDMDVHAPRSSGERDGALFNFLLEPRGKGWWVTAAMTADRLTSFISEQTDKNYCLRDIEQYQIRGEWRFGLYFSFRDCKTIRYYALQSVEGHETSLQANKAEGFYPVSVRLNNYDGQSFVSAVYEKDRTDLSTTKFRFATSMDRFIEGKFGAETQIYNMDFWNNEGFYETYVILKNEKPRRHSAYSGGLEGLEGFLATNRSLKIAAITGFADTFIDSTSLRYEVYLKD